MVLIIDQTLDGGRRPALAVHQYQSASGSQVAQVQGGDARFAVGERVRKELFTVVLPARAGNVTAKSMMLAAPRPPGRRR